MFKIVNQTNHGLCDALLSCLTVVRYRQNSVTIPNASKCVAKRGENTLYRSPSRSEESDGYTS